MSAHRRKDAGLRKFVLAAALCLFGTAALADTCSGRAEICSAACTPRNVASGAQAGGTVQGCERSCKARLARCMKTGVWVHMGSARSGEQQKVDRQ